MLVSRVVSGIPRYPFYAIRLLSTQNVPPKHNGRRTFFTVSLALAVSASAYTVGAIYPPTALKMLFPRVAPPPPPNSEAPEVVTYLKSLEEQLQTLPLLQSLRSAENSSEYYETRPYRTYPPERAVNNLTAGSLKGPGKLALSPIVRAKKDESAAYIFVHLGRSLCGHDGIIHGGLLATIMDEALGRTAINNFPDKVGVTATLTINYKAPTYADQFVIIKTSLDELRGRKAKVSGRIEALDGNLLVEASAVFVQPRYAKLLNTSLIRKAMGESPTAEGDPPHKGPVLLE